MDNLGGPWVINKQILLDSAVDTRRLRLVHLNNREDSNRIAREAMVAGNSQTVISSSTTFSEIERAHFDEAANQGHCQAILVQAQQLNPH